KRLRHRLGSWCGVMAIEERSFVTNGATLDEGQGRLWGLDLAGEEEGRAGCGKEGLGARGP
ncbi:MAG: hypothetical protein ABSD87_13370, partial [Candidatus Acidiferrales bacterium]